jgi:CheY-like chemotaxis protein
MTDSPAPPPAVTLPSAGANPFASRAPGILVADDDPMLLPLLQLVLKARGFTVWAAPTGLHAVELYSRHHGAIDLVLLDVRMPGLDGPQTLAALRRLDAGVTCCFMTGFAGSYSGDELHALGACRCFEKPFQVQQLGDELWQLAQGEARRSPALSVE